MYSIDAWKKFAQGHWQKEMPRRQGTYPTATRERRRAADRTVVITTKDKFLDVRSRMGTDPKGLEEGTRWKGWWWSEPYPELMEIPIWGDE